MQELWFLQPACSLMLIDIYMKFREDSFKVFKLQSQYNFVTESKGNNSKSINARVMVLLVCTSFNVDGYLYEVS